MSWPIMSLFRLAVYIFTYITYIRGILGKLKPSEWRDSMDMDENSSLKSTVMTRWTNSVGHILVIFLTYHMSKVIIINNNFNNALTL